MSDEIANTILKEIRDFRTEEEKRWEENDRRWKESNKKLKENTERITKLEKATKENIARIINLEMVTAENNNNVEIEKIMDEKFDKIQEIKLANDIEHVKFAQIFQVISKRYPETLKRIEELEKWRKNIEGNLFTV